MTARMLLSLVPAVLVAAGGAWWLWLQAEARAADTAFDAAYAKPLPPPSGPLTVFHLGHSLVGRDMPAMLAQLAPEGHRYESQLGWGTSLKEHWEPGESIRGFEEENDHPRYRDAKEAIGSGDYGAVVLTEMVEIRDAIRYHDSATYLARWANLAWQANPDTRVYLYETWHPLDDPEGWLERLDADPKRFWEAKLLRPAFAVTGKPIRVIPAGRVMARFVRAVEQAGGVGNVAGRESLFAVREDGSRDPIHLGDLGSYLVALTHYAVLYQQSPVGLPFRLNRADGSAADAPSARAARLMQETVWDVVTGIPETGVTP